MVFTRVDVGHRSTVDDEIRLVVGEYIVELVGVLQRELCEGNLERRLRGMKRPTHVPFSTETCVNDVTAEQSIGADDEYPHTGNVPTGK